MIEPTHGGSIRVEYQQKSLDNPAKEKKKEDKLTLHYHFIVKVILGRKQPKPQ